MADDLSRYLDITPDQARRQWRQILGREWGMQANYLPVEVILCYALFWVLDPHRAGKTNIRTLSPEAGALTDTFRRSDRSLVSKMLNLDGSLSNCARWELDVFREFARSPDLEGVLGRKTRKVNTGTYGPGGTATCRRTRPAHDHGSWILHRTLPSTRVTHAAHFRVGPTKGSPEPFKTRRNLRGGRVRVRRPALAHHRGPRPLHR